MKRSGFTLIELLIVVAIIAILAAIAVPNFLEAQVRAKVSRCHSDMRTFATALESYVVDNHGGPLCNNEWGFYPNTPGYSNIAAQALLTSPIAYMTSVPKEVFCATSKAKGKNGALFDQTNYTYRAYFRPEVFPAGNAVRACAGRGYTWSFHSFGPSRDAAQPVNKNQFETLANALVGGQPMTIYDPSNGTVSYGWVFRTNKGVGSGADYAGL